MKADLNSEFSVQVLKELWEKKGARFDGQEGEREGWEEEKGERAQVGIEQGLLSIELTFLSPMAQAEEPLTLTIMKKRSRLIRI